MTDVALVSLSRTPKTFYAHERCLWSVWDAPPRKDMHLRIFNSLRKGPLWVSRKRKRRRAWYISLSGRASEGRSRTRKLKDPRWKDVEYSIFRIDNKACSELVLRSVADHLVFPTLTLLIGITTASEGQFQATNSVGRDENSNTSSQNAHEIIMDRLLVTSREGSWQVYHRRKRRTKKVYIQPPTRENGICPWLTITSRNDQCCPPLSRLMSIKIDDKRRRESLQGRTQTSPKDINPPYQR
jgi:hypothetical protein